METQAVCKGPNTEIVRDFQEMLSSLTTQPCFTGLVGGLNEATKLRKQVEKLNERVRTTESKYESDKETMHTTHESSMKKFLQVHCNEIAQKTKEIDSLKEETSTLGRQLENERESGRTNTDQINKLEQSVARMIKQQKTDEEKLLQAEAKRHKLMEQLQRKSDEVITAQKDMEAVKKQLFQLHKSYTDLDAAKVSTEARLQAATRSLDNVKAYTSVIHQEAPRTEVFETLARSFYDVVGAAFQEDIAENVIRKPQPSQSYQEKASPKIKFPLPASNTPVAKSMRTILALSYLAKQLESYLFRPVYYIDTSSSPSPLRDALIDQARADPNKERLCSALLLSLADSEEVDVDEAEENVVKRVVKEMISLAEILMPLQKAHQFGEALTPIVKNTLETWKYLQRCKVKVEADDGSYNMGRPWAWKTMNISKERPSIDDADPVVDDDCLIVFPRVYIIDKTDYHAVFSGLRVERWQVRPAEDEIMSIQASNGTSAENQVSPTNGTRRRMSSAISRGSRNGVDRAFLGNE